MHEMRVLHLVGRSQRRGAELVALELATALDRLGHANTVLACCPGFDGTIDPAFAPLTRRTRMDPVALAIGVRHLRTRLRYGSFDVVLAHGGWAVQVAALTRRAAPAPLLVWQRILDFSADMTQRGRRVWWQFVAGRIDAAVALTPQMEQEVRRLGFHGPVWQIANFRNPERFVSVDRADVKAQLHRELGVDPNVPLLGLVGHLIEQKRPERALDVLARVRAEGTPAHLVIAGNGPLRGELTAETHTRRLDDWVHLLGHRDDVERVLGGIDVLLLTSDAEGIPGIVIEAQMTGCPVVTFPLGAVGTVVEDGTTGVVLPSSDTRLMAQTVSELLRCPSRLRALGEAGRRRADQFSTNRAATQYVIRLQELLARHRTSTP
jgi:glycosyltransferase involved in cell wall biosynthesis